MSPNDGNYWECMSLLSEFDQLTMKKLIYKKWKFKRETMQVNVQINSPQCLVVDIKKR